MWNLLFVLSLIVSLAAATPAQIAKLLADDGAASDDFGVTVAISGDGNTVIVGAQHAGGSGAAYVYRLSNGLWIHEAKLIQSDPSAGDLFGVSVAVSGDGRCAVVGAWDDAMGSESGAAYVFTVDEHGNWTQDVKLKASDASGGDRFGMSVAISRDGSRIVVSAYWDDDGGIDSGSVYIFSKVGGSWIEDQKLIASDSAMGDWFGWSTAIDGNGTRILVGSRFDGDDGEKSGSVYVFKLSSTGWVEEVKLTASDAGVGHQFGSAVSLSADGTTALVGSSEEDHAGSMSGAAYVFNFVSDIWTESAKLTSHNGSEGDRFGYSVSISGDGRRACVGAFGRDLQAGSAFLFNKYGEEWAETEMLAPSDLNSGDKLGHRVWIDFNGSRAIVNARGDDEIETNAGAAYIWNFQRYPTASPTVGPTSTPPATKWNWSCNCDLRTQSYADCLNECRQSRGTRWSWTCDYKFPKSNYTYQC